MVDQGVSVLVFLGVFTAIILCRVAPGAAFSSYATAYHLTNRWTLR